MKNSLARSAWIRTACLAAAPFCCSALQAATAEVKAPIDSPAGVSAWMKFLPSSAAQPLLGSLGLAPLAPAQVGAMAQVLDRSGVRLNDVRSTGMPDMQALLIRLKVQRYAAGLTERENPKNPDPAPLGEAPASGEALTPAQFDILASLAPGYAARLATAKRRAEERIMDARAWNADGGIEAATPDRSSSPRNSLARPRTAGNTVQADSGIGPPDPPPPRITPANPKDMVGQGRYKTLWEEHRDHDLSSFKNIVIDVRGSRGGWGDVSAGYLVAMNLLKKAERAGVHGPSIRITFIIDENAQRILSGLSNKSISPGQTDFGGKVLFHTVDSLPKAFPTADLYLALSSPNGTFRFPENLHRVPIGPKTVVIVQTVLGNTEDPESLHPFGSLKIGDRTFRLLPAGLAEDESGLYSDYVAWDLRGRSRLEIKNFIVDRLPSIRNERDRVVIRGLLNGVLFSGSEPGLAYVRMRYDSQSQYMTYLKGLAASGKSYCLISPFSFSKELIPDRALRDRIEIIGPHEIPLPSDAEAGKIYILRTSGFPHPVFVGLMAYSYPPPVIAGDLAKSAAVVLGRPFVLTKVDWNAKNIGNLLAALIAREDRPEIRELLGRIYSETSPDLREALELEAHAALYEGLVYSLKGLESSMFAAAQALTLHMGSSIDELLLHHVDEVMRKLPPDWALRAEVLRHHRALRLEDTLRRRSILDITREVVEDAVEMGADGSVETRPPSKR